MNRYKTPFLATLLVLLCGFVATPAAAEEPDAYIELGGHLGFIADETTPTSALSKDEGTVSTKGASFTAGHWLIPVLAVEGQGYITDGDGSGLSGNSHFEELGLQGGVRLALPTLVTPFVSARVGYNQRNVGWFGTIADSDGTNFRTRGDDLHHMVMLNMDLGLNVGYGMFTSSFVLQSGYNIAHNIDRDVVAPASKDLAFLDNIQEKQFEAFEQINTGMEMRVGVRF